MKTLLLISVIALATFSFTPTVQASALAQNICEYVSVDDKPRLRSYLKANKLKIRKIFDGVQCNGKNLIEFADSQNSLKTGSLMIGKLSKKTIRTYIASINSAELIDC
jgi:ACT domain-containing protein